jgi:hypothetical protein
METDGSWFCSIPETAIMSKRMQHKYVGIAPPTSTSCYIHAIRGYNAWYRLLSRLGRTADREKSTKKPIDVSG